MQPVHGAPVAPVPVVVLRFVVRVMFEGECPDEDQGEDVGDGECREIGVGGGGHAGPSQHRHCHQVPQHPHGAEHGLHVPVDPEPAAVAEQERRGVDEHLGLVVTAIHDAATDTDA